MHEGVYVYYVSDISMVGSSEWVLDHLEPSSRCVEGSRPKTG